LEGKLERGNSTAEKERLSRRALKGREGLFTGIHSVQKGVLVKRKRLQPAAGSRVEAQASGLTP